MTDLGSKKSTGSTGAVRLIDIARKAGVSKITVSKVLHDHGGSNTRVSEATAKKVRQIAHEMNYRPNMAARQLTSQKSYLIGGLIDSMAPLTYTKRLMALERTAADAGYRLIVGYSHGEVDRIGSHLEYFLSRGVDGIVSLSHTYPDHGSEITKLLKMFKNCVLIEPALEDGGFSYVSLDYVEAGYLATKHLLQNGRRRIAFLAHGLAYQVVQDWLNGFRKAYNEFGVVLDPAFVVEPDPAPLDDAVAAGRNVDRLLAVKPDSIFVANDGVAMWTIRALVNRGLRVPQDIAIVSGDGWDVGRSYVPTITSIDMNSQEMGRIAMTLLLNQINHPDEAHKPEKRLLPPRLVIGESCGSQI